MSLFDTISHVFRMKKSIDGERKEFVAPRREEFFNCLLSKEFEEVFYNASNSTSESLQELETLRKRIIRECDKANKAAHSQAIDTIKGLGASQEYNTSQISYNAFRKECCEFIKDIFGKRKSILSDDIFQKEADRLLDFFNYKIFLNGKQIDIWDLDISEEIIHELIRDIIHNFRSYKAQLMNNAINKALNNEK